jgi:hypothetical protein
MLRSAVWDARQYVGFRPRVTGSRAYLCPTSHHALLVWLLVWQEAAVGNLHSRDELVGGKKDMGYKKGHRADGLKNNAHHRPRNQRRSGAGGVGFGILDRPCID